MIAKHKLMLSEILYLILGFFVHFSYFIICMRWLLQSSLSINSSDRQYIFQLFKKTVYSANEEEFQNRCTEVLNDLTVMKYPNFLSYIKGLFEKHIMWAHCFQNLNRGFPLDNVQDSHKEVYIGATKRNFSERLLEHKICIQKGNLSTALAQRA